MSAPQSDQVDGERRMAGGSKMLAGLGVALALAACSLPSSDPAAEALAKKAFMQLRQGDLVALAAETERESWGPNPQPVLTQMRSALPPGEPTAVHLVGFNSFVGTGGSTLTLTHRYDYADRQVIASTTLLKTGKGEQAAWIIRGFHINVGMPAPPATNAPAVNAPEPTARTKPSPALPKA
jgi:hypothetical protein